MDIEPKDVVREILQMRPDYDSEDLAEIDDERLEWLMTDWDASRLSIDIQLYPAATDDLVVIVSQRTRAAKINAVMCRSTEEIPRIIRNVVAYVTNQTHGVLRKPIIYERLAQEARLLNNCIDLSGINATPKWYWEGVSSLFILAYSKMMKGRLLNNAIPIVYNDGIFMQDESRTAIRLMNEAKQDWCYGVREQFYTTR